MDPDLSELSEQIERRGAEVKYGMRGEALRVACAKQFAAYLATETMTR